MEDSTSSTGQPADEELDAAKLQTDLLRVFEQHGVQVAVGLGRNGGVAIRSQDDRVDAQNIGMVYALAQAD